MKPLIIWVLVISASAFADETNREVTNILGDEGRPTPRRAESSSERGAEGEEGETPTHHSGGFRPEERPSFGFETFSPMIEKAVQPEPVPVAPTNLELAREALQDEVAKGNLPKEAVEGLLSKIGPVLEKIADKIEAAGGDPKKIEEIIQETPELSIRRSEDGSAVQVIAQVMSNSSGQSSTEGVRSVSKTAGKPTGEVTSLVVRKEGSSPGSNGMGIVYVGKASKGTGSLGGDKLPGLKEDLKEEKLRRPLALGEKTPWIAPISSAKAGTPQSIASGSAGPAKGVGGALPGAPKTKTGIQALISSLLQKKEGASRGLASEGRAPAVLPERAGFPLLKLPKLSLSSPLWNFPKEVWTQSSPFSVQSRLGWKLPFWLDLALVLSAFAVSLTMFWLVWRRRFFARRVITVSQDKRDAV